MLQRFETADGFVGYRSPLLSDAGIPHLFTTKRGPGGAAMGLGALNAVEERELCRRAGAPDARLVNVRQVHGCEAFVAADEIGAADVEADAVISTRSDRAVFVYTADCVPVLVANRDGSRVAAIHAGWRGLVAGVIESALAHLDGPGLAAIGPCLSRARFEVGPEVAEAFRAADLPQVVQDAAPRPYVDLRLAAELQLRRAGITAIDSNDRCTWDHAADFYSFRRDVTHGGAPTTGRLAAIIAPRRRSRS